MPAAPQVFGNKESKAQDLDFLPMRAMDF